MRKHSFFCFLFLVVIIAGAIAQFNSSAFQPFNSQGENLIHVTTADFEGIGIKEYVVAMTVEGKVIAFQRIDQITDPADDNRLWEYTALPSMGITLVAAEVIENSPGEEVILPGTDGYLRILSSTGELLREKQVSTGALYTADVASGADGQPVVVTAGVDGLVYFLDQSLVQLAAVAPARVNQQGVAGVISHVVAGDFNGDGIDEVMSFLNNRSFRGNCFFELTDLSTFNRPAYWNGVTDANEDDVALALGYTDKQMPYAYDMDGDGDEEVTGHWGVFHPEKGPRTQLFSTMLTEDEKTALSDYEKFAQNYLIQYYGFEKSDKESLTNTGKYLLQQGVPGDFDNDGKAELFTIYGDDLFLSQYDPVQKKISISDYTWAQSMYHFSDGACLQDRSGGADKLVLTGPINGDDHFYLLDLSGQQWKTDARNICCAGKFAEVEYNLDQLTDGVSQFSGTVAEGNEPVWYIDYFASWVGWPMTPENIAARSQAIFDAQQEWYDRVGEKNNHRSSRIRFAASIGSRVYGLSPQCTDPDITEEGMVAFCRALAQKGAWFCLMLGHGNNLYMTPENFADCYEASIKDGECYMMARTLELVDQGYFDLYKPHLDAVLARAGELGTDPPMVMLCAKGAIFSAMPQAQGDEYFPKYKDVLVPGVENSNVTVLEWSLAERVGLWMNADVKRWGCNVIGDNLAANRVVEWGGMRNAHVVLRQLLSQYALGARVFRITSVTGLENPMYIRGDETGEDHEWSQPFQKGVLNFLKIIEKGIYPYSPDPHQLKSISPVSVALYNGTDRLQEQSFKHDHYKYLPESDDFVFNRLACWNAYTDVPENDITAFLYGTKRRWDNLIPSVPGGFVTIVPHENEFEVESKSWCSKAYQTNGDYWDDYSLTAAKEVICNEILAQRQSLDFYVEGECFWQVTRQKDDPFTYFVLLMGNNVLSPAERKVSLKAGSWINGRCQVFDQLGSEAELPIGVLSDTADELELTIPAGVPRILCIKLSSLPANKENEFTDRFGMTVYPNPAADKAFIELSASCNSETLITIYNSAGKRVLHRKGDENIYKVDVSHWSPGVYLVHVQRASDMSIAKIVVE